MDSRHRFGSGGEGVYVPRFTIGGFPEKEWNFWLLNLNLRIRF